MGKKHTKLLDESHTRRTGRREPLTPEALREEGSATLAFCTSYTRVDAAEGGAPTASLYLNWCDASDFGGN
jgi:hypothetical protein